MCRQARISAAILIAGAGLLSIAGCAATGQPESTRLTAGDLRDSSARMSAALAASPFLVDRTPESDPIVVTFRQVENLSSDIVPPREQWMLMAEVVNALPIAALRRTHAVRFVIPPERRGLARDGGYDGEFDDVGLPATHLVKASIRSITRAGRTDGRTVDVRQDGYQIEYLITDVRNGDVVWSEIFEFKRLARGIAID